MYVHNECLCISNYSSTSSVVGVRILVNHYCKYVSSVVVYEKKCMSIIMICMTLSTSDVGM